MSAICSTTTRQQQEQQQQALPSAGRPRAPGAADWLAATPHCTHNKHAYRHTSSPLDSWHRSPPGPAALLQLLACSALYRHAPRPMRTQHTLSSYTHMHTHANPHPLPITPLSPPTACRPPAAGCRASADHLRRLRRGSGPRPMTTDNRRNSTVACDPRPAAGLPRGRGGGEAARLPNGRCGRCPPAFGMRGLRRPLGQDLGATPSRARL